MSLQLLFRDQKWGLYAFLLLLWAPRSTRVHLMNQGPAEGPRLKPSRWVFFRLSALGGTLE